MDTPINPPHVAAGDKNDPSVEVSFGGKVDCCTPEFREAMRQLGFKESQGSFVYHANGRAIWVNPNSPEMTEDVTRQIVEGAEAIGRRTKINEIKSVLDIPFGVLDVIKPSHEQ